jgi:hypothetical protein
MPKNPVIDPITDQEIAFAHLILSGTMNDRSAAEAVGLNPATAAYTKAKPRVRAYMAEHRAAVNQKLVDQQVEEVSQYSIGRERILTRLWELATLSPEVTRGSITAQMKALSMIVAIEGLIPDRRLARGPARSASASAQPAPGHTHESPAASAPNPTPNPAPKPSSAPAQVASTLAPEPTTEPITVVNPFVHPSPVTPAPLTLENAFDFHIRHYSELQLPSATRTADLRRGR